jgi:exonuclease VII large subunit
LTEVRQRIERGRETLSGVPARLDLAGERVRSASDRLRADTRLDAREREVLQATSEITAVVREFFRTHVSGLTAASATLVTTPRQAAGALAAQQATLASAGTTLARTDQRLHSLATRIAELGDQISAATNRQLTSHAHNYSRAIARVSAEAIAGLERVDRHQRELIARESERLDAGVRNRLVDARRAVTHRAALIAAHDFRRRGWLLASKAGKTVRSVADLNPGDRLELQFHDGSAHATVKQVDPQKGPTP